MLSPLKPRPSAMDQLTSPPDPPNVGCSGEGASANAEVSKNSVMEG